MRRPGAPTTERSVSFYDTSTAMTAREKKEQEARTDELLSSGDRKVRVGGGERRRGEEGGGGNRNPHINPPQHHQRPSPFDDVKAPAGLSRQRPSPFDDAGLPGSIPSPSNEAEQTRAALATPVRRLLVNQDSPGTDVKPSADVGMQQPPRSKALARVMGAAGVGGSTSRRRSSAASRLGQAAADDDDVGGSGGDSSASPALRKPSTPAWHGPDGTASVSLTDKRPLSARCVLGWGFLSLTFFLLFCCCCFC